jgi:phage FluMu protein Com
MKLQKEVQMVCPKCKVKFEAEPIIMIQADGNSHLEHHLPKHCKYCNGGLMRYVIKVKT